MDVGDENNKIFHSAIKIREVMDNMREIVCVDGTLAKTDEEIKEEAEKFFTDFMTDNPQDFEGATEERLKELLGFQCSSADCEKL